MEMSCKSYASCNGMQKPDMRPKNDLRATPKFKKVMGEFKQGSLRTPSNQAVNDPKQAVAIAASESGQSYNQQTRKQKTADRYGMRKR